MSAKKRRIKRKLALLHRLDQIWSRRYLKYTNGPGSKPNPKRNGAQAWRVWYSMVVPLGDAMQNQGIKAWESLERQPVGTDILLHNWRKRNPQHVVKK